MDKKKINYFLLLSILLFILIFLIDTTLIFHVTIISSNANSRNVLIMVAILFLFLSIKNWYQEITIYKKIKYLLLFSALLLMVNFFSPQNKLFYDSYSTTIYYSIAAIFSILIMLINFVLIKELIFVQRKKNTGRNFYLLFLLLIIYSFFAQSQ